MDNLPRNRILPAPIPYSNHGGKSLDEKLLEPFVYITQIPDNATRLKLLQAFNYWLDIPEQSMAYIESQTKIILNACLLLDDIQDDSSLRRGLPVAHSIYGIPITINAVSYVSCIALENILDLNNPEAYDAFLESTLEQLRGQGMEIYWRDSFTCPTEEEYIQMAEKKTGGVVAFAVKLMGIFSRRKEDFTKLSCLLGLIYQIINDYKNLKSEAYFKKKSYCDDLTEGKFSFPIIHAIRSHPNDRQIVRILRQRPTDYNTKQFCVTLLENFGSFEYTRNRLEELRKEITLEINKFGGNPSLEEFVDFLFKNIV